LKISKEARVGGFAVLTITILYLGFNYLKGIDFFNKSEKYYVIYNDVAGLTLSNPVNISGYTVGRVSAVKINQEFNNTILVEMDIDRTIVLGDSTKALLDVGLLGDVSITLEVGNLTNPIEPGDTLLAQVDPTLNELLKSSALPVADNLQITIRRLNELLADFGKNSEDIQAIIKNTRGITATTNRMLAENRANAKETIEGFKDLTVRLNGTMDDLGVLMNKYGGVADSLMAVDFQATLNETTKMMATLNETLEMMQDENGTIGRFLTDDSVYVSLNKSLIDLDLLLIHMNENPKHFFGPLGKSQKKIEKDLQKQANKNN
jgi:phospholipid/cholesterol/gamma-HCH transport system substrate-binding protein